MAINYVRYGELSATYELEEFEERVLLFDPVAERQPTRAIGDRYRRLDPSLRDVDLVVIRAPSPKLAETISADPVLQQELADTPVCLLAPVASDRVVSMEVGPINGYSFRAPTLTLTTLRDAEVGFLIDHRGVVEKPDNVHFALPSGIHADRFVDVSRLCRDPVDVSRLADWILPHVPPHTAIVTDWGGILALAQAVQLRMWEVAGWRPVIDVLEGYPHDLVAVGRRIEDVANREAGLKKILLLLSVNSSGGLAAAFRQLASEVSSPTVVALVHTREQSSGKHLLEDSLAQRPIMRWVPGADGRCERCQEVPKVIGVQPETLERRADLDWVRLKPTHDEFSRNSEFWQAASDSGAVSLCSYREHRTATGAQARHHAVFLDVQRLLQNPVIWAASLSKLRDRESPDVVLLPEHQATDAIEALVVAAFPAIQRFRIAPSQPLTGSAREVVSRSRKVLLCDDAIVTGETLIRLKNWTYRLSQEVGKDIGIEAFAPVARPPSEIMLNHIRRPFFRDKHGMTSAFVVLLPSGVDCPWCEERTVLRGLRKQLPSSHHDVLQSRIALLEGEVRHPNSEKGCTTFGAYAGNLSAPAAFAAASSVATVLRAKLEDQSPLQVKVLDVPFVVSAFFDATLLGPMFRTLKRKHLRYSGFESELEAILAARPAESLPEQLVREFAWAAVTGKLPHGPVERLLQSRQDVGLVGALHAQLRARRRILSPLRPEPAEGD